MSDLVTLHHPELPADQTIRVDRRRLGPRLAAGWREAVEPSTESKPITESAPTRRGRKNSEEQ